MQSIAIIGIIVGRSHVKYEEREVVEGKDMTQQHTQLNAHTSHLTSLVLAVTDELLGVGRAHRTVLLASNVEPNAVLRRDAEGASEGHLRPPLRQAHGNLGRPVPDKRGLVVPPPLVRFLTEFFNKLDARCGGGPKDLESDGVERFADGADALLHREPVRLASPLLGPLVFLRHGGRVGDLPCALLAHEHREAREPGKRVHHAAVDAQVLAVPPDAGGDDVAGPLVPVVE